jgi:antirestriction protein ArdC
MEMASAPASTVSAKDEKVNEALDRIVKMFTTGDMPAAVARTVIHAKETDTPSARWSLSNRILMLLAGTDDARGYRQWQEVGRYVRKGAKAFHILAPRTLTVTVTDPETGEERKEQRVVGFIGVPVFRYEDTDGKPLERPDYKPAELPPLMDVAERFGVRVNWGPFGGRAYGWYRPGINEIQLLSHDVDVFFHELAHAAHNRIRPLRGGQDPMQEIVAETVAAVLCELYGYRGYIRGAAEYVASYAKGNPGKAILKVLAEVEQVLNLILEAAEVSSDGRAA